MLLLVTNEKLSDIPLDVPYNYCGF